MAKENNKSKKVMTTNESTNKSNKGKSTSQKKKDVAINEENKNNQHS